MRFVRAASCNSEGSVSVTPQSLARLRRIELCCPSLRPDCERERLNHSLIKFFKEPVVLSVPYSTVAEINWQQTSQRETESTSPMLGFWMLQVGTCVLKFSPQTLHEHDPRPCRGSNSSEDCNLTLHGLSSRSKTTFEIRIEPKVQHHLQLGS